MQPSETAKAFLQTVCEQVRWKQAHEVISRDLADHMEDQAEAYVRGGMDCEAASARAVQEMGDPVDVGLLMDASYRPKIEWRMLIALGSLVAAGLLIRAIFYQLSMHEWLAYTLALLIGAGFFLLMQRVNFYRMLKWAWYLEIAFLLLTMGIPLLSRVLYPTYGAMQLLWLLYPVVYTLIIYRMRGSKLLGLIATGALLAVPLFLRLFMADPITLYEMIAAAACFVVTIAAICLGCYRCNRVIAVAMTTIVSALGVAVVIISEPYRMARVLGMLNPASDPLGDGYLTLRIRELIESSVWLGRGGEISDATQYFLAQNGAFSSDHALTCLIYQYGYIVIACLALLILAFLAFGLNRIKRIGSQLGKLLAAAILMALATQSILYMLPSVGYPFTSSSVLPFVTGNSIVMIADFILVGLLFSLFRADTLFTDTLPRRWKKLRLHISVDVGLEEK